ncbi:MAG TPA: DUF4367 domain-containing protein [Candidatus Saccharimonadales bacterium]|nr:DUF4367 domain-containing protein [Candidatus Saccharimonadales bacterium]
MSQNVIELNGKRYDAITGDLLGPSTASAVSHLAAKHAGTPAPGRVVDGFFRKPQAGGVKAKSAVAPTPVKHAAPAKHTPVKTVRSPKAITPSRAVAPLKPVTAAKPLTAEIKPMPSPRPKPRSAAEMHALPAKPVVKKIVPTAAQHHAGHAQLRPHEHAKPAARHEMQHSKTLKRSVVHKPDVRMKPAIKPQSPAEIAAAPASSLLRKRSVASVDPTRAERAKLATRNANIQRFNVAHYGTTPVKHTVQHIGPLPVIPVKNHPLPIAAPHQEAPARHGDIFENAIKHARSHEQPLHHPHMRRRHRFINIAAGVAVLFVLGGFVAYTNMPNIQMHIASVEAGFHASMPNYAPTGYALRGGVHHAGGTVTMNYVSGDSSYQITQQSSNWDSQALLDNTLALSGPHRTIERGGRTIYVYDGSNASWVTGNVRYDITGTASLSADELAAIASSM